MSTRQWIALLASHEFAWGCYLVQLFRVVFALLLRAPHGEIANLLSTLAILLPIALVIGAVAWAIAIRDVLGRPSVQGKGLWIFGFIFIGIVTLPIYYALFVYSRRSDSVATTG